MFKKLIFKYFIKKNKPTYIVKPIRNDFVVSQMYMKTIDKSDVSCFGEHSKLNIKRFFIFAKTLFSKCKKIKNKLIDSQYNDFIIENTISNIIENKRFKIIIPQEKRRKRSIINISTLFTLFFILSCLITSFITFYNLIPNQLLNKWNNNLKYDFFPIITFSDDLKEKLAPILTTFINIHIPIFIGFIGVYFTVLGIALNSKKNVSFKSYFKFTSTISFYINCIILLINFICTLVLARHPVYSNFLLTIYIFNILHILFCCFFAISKMACIQDYKKATIILQNNSVKYIHKNKKSKENPIYGDYFNFLRKCFDSESYDIFLNSILEKNCFSLKDTAQLKIYYDSMLQILFYKAEDISVDEIEYTFKIITKQILNLLSLNVLNYSIINYLIDSFSQIYSRVIYNEDLTNGGKKIPSYLNLYRDSICPYLLRFKYNVTLQQSFSFLLDKSVTIITTSIFKNNKTLTEELLKDFRFMTQPFSVQTEIYNLILEKYQDCLVDIIVNILYSIYRDQSLIDYSEKILDLLDDLDVIRIYSVDRYYYEEKNPSPHMIEVKYERSFFIILFLIFLKDRDDKKNSSTTAELETINNNSNTTPVSDLFNNFFNKLTYGDKDLNDNFSKSYLHFSILQRCSENFKPEDNILNITKFNEYLKEIQDLLSNKIKNAKDKHIKDLVNKITNEQLNERINKEINNFKETYANYSNGKNFTNPTKIILKTNFSFSAHDILGINNSSFEINHEKYYHRILLNSYIATRNTQPIQIKNLSEIYGLKRNEKNILYGPLNYRTYFRNHNLEVEYNENTFTIDNFNFYLINMNISFPGFILKSDLEALISLETIQPYPENCDKRKQEDSIDIFYDVPIDVTFNFEMGQRLKIYKLI